MKGIDNIIDTALRKSGISELSLLDRTSLQKTYGDLEKLHNDRQLSLKNYKDRAVLFPEEDFSNQIKNLDGTYEYSSESVIDEALLKEKKYKLDKDGLIDQDTENKLKVIENTKDVKKYSDNNTVINIEKKEKITNRYFQTTKELLGKEYQKASSTFARSASQFQVGNTPLYKSIENTLKDPEETAKVVADMNNIDGVYETELAKNVV
jgi:hypothetical protein